MKVEETCSCGAALTFEEVSATWRQLTDAVIDFRRNHRHEFAPAKAEAPAAPLTSTNAIGYALPEANNGYDETGGPHDRLGFERYRGATRGNGD